jgi:ABC-type branched-subunit amino acid transport system substrate-binding protein
MAGLTHANDTTGKDKRANGFRHFFNSYMSGAALAPILANQYGADRKAYYLTADYNWGYTTEQAIREATEAAGWETVANVLTPLGAGDFSSYITPVLGSGADVLVLVHYGGDMVNSLTNAVQFGLRQQEANGKPFEIVVPLYSELMARGAGRQIAGILGSQNWDWKLENQLGERYVGTNAFVQSFGEKYGFPPSQAAHTGYVQALLYADAVNRAGTFDPCGVVEALQGFEFDGMGNGPTLYRADDHQCFKDVVVVRGKENPENEFDLVEIVEVTPVDQVTYAPDHPQFAGGQLGSCNSGA